MIAGIYISQEMFANDVSTALKPSLEHDPKHVLRLLRLYEDQAKFNLLKLQTCIPTGTPHFLVKTIHHYVTSSMVIPITGTG